MQQWVFQESIFQLLWYLVANQARPMPPCVPYCTPMCRRSYPHKMYGRALSTVCIGSRQYGRPSEWVHNHPTRFVSRATHVLTSGNSSLGHPGRKCEGRHTVVCYSDAARLKVHAIARRARHKGVDRVPQTKKGPRGHAGSFHTMTPPEAQATDATAEKGPIAPGTGDNNAAVAKDQ